MHSYALKKKFCDILILHIEKLFEICEGSLGTKIGLQFLQDSDILSFAIMTHNDATAAVITTLSHETHMTHGIEFSLEEA